ncbi:MAG TPA: S41 family peptidase [Candidatus Polarisedimenticolaceae bacterium]|nr:S41 family peptidase [Candidatus Polarisedimenticolaceae bacterium]
MKTGRSLLLLASTLVMVFLLGGGLIVKVGAADSSYRQAVLFAEVLSQVLDNYVDPIEAEGLLEGAYDGMLGGLDPNGAYLSRAEAEEWKSVAAAGSQPGADPGLTVLKSGRALQVVAVLDGSPAAEAGIKVGDQIRAVGEVEVRDLSLRQARHRIEGDPGSAVQIELFHPADGFRRESVELVRRPRDFRPYRLDVERGTAVLRLLDLGRIDLDALGAELDDVRSRPTERLLIDLRNSAGSQPRAAATVAALFTSPPPLRLRDRSGRLVETIETPARETAWTGSIAVLVNGATAEGAEALALLLGERADVPIFGEKTFGLGAEPSLFELESGSALLLSSAQWETADGKSWHDRGIDPDEVIAGEGDDYAEVAADQLQRVLERMESGRPVETPAEREAA